uniref:TORTIFOLIA1/SINE1-2 N-terminal domain-containing protein n=1 Tax=Zea mays TaxID=4577 RepID=A0A804U6W7_MAIZE
MLLRTEWRLSTGTLLNSTSNVQVYCSLIHNLLLLYKDATKASTTHHGSASIRDSPATRSAFPRPTPSSSRISPFPCRITHADLSIPIACVLESDDLSAFVHAVLDAQPTDKSPLRRHVLRALALVAASHPCDVVAPLILHILAVALHRVWDQDSSVRAVLVDTARDVALHVSIVGVHSLHHAPVRRTTPSLVMPLSCSRPSPQPPRHLRLLAPIPSGHPASPHAAHTLPSALMPPSPPHHLHCTFAMNPHPLTSTMPLPCRDVHGRRARASQSAFATADIEEHFDEEEGSEPEEEAKVPRPYSSPRSRTPPSDDPCRLFVGNVRSSGEAVRSSTATGSVVAVAAFELRSEFDRDRKQLRSEG